MEDTIRKVDNDTSVERTASNRITVRRRIRKKEYSAEMYVFSAHDFQELRQSILDCQKLRHEEPSLLRRLARKAARVTSVIFPFF